MHRNPPRDFAIALYLNPELGQHIRFINIETYAEARPRDTIFLGPDLHTVLEAALISLPLHNEERDEWKTALRQGDISVVLPLIAVKATSLRSIRVPHREGIPKRLSTLRESDPSVLSTLQELDVVY
jgi:hypothetical protein